VVFLYSKFFAPDSPPILSAVKVFTCREGATEALIASNSARIIGEKAGCDACVTEEVPFFLDLTVHKPKA
jgi:hypothetical protein